VNPIHNWESEKQSAYLYRILAESESKPERKKLFEKLAEEAEKQAAIWESKFTPGLSPTHFSVPLKIRVAAVLIRWVGPRAMKGILSAMKVRGMSVYQPQISFHAMPDQLSQVGSRHQSLGAGNWLRASVFGANDGLVSNASLIMGVAGASLDSHAVLLTGFAGMIGGAFSMACGEYISVKSQREFFEKQINLEREELENYPEEEAAELALIFEARGIPKADAERNAKTLIADPHKALETLAREELGVNPNDLGSPGMAASSSFLSFLLGAFIPLFPFLISLPVSGLTASMGLSGVALFVIGASLSLFTGKSALWGGTRMLLLGVFSGGCTFYLGKLLDVTLS
jgi:vacuolar iron transporter family protein